VVRVAGTTDEFVAAIEQTLAEPARQRADWRVAAQAAVDRCTWDGTAARIAALLQAHVHAGSAQPILLDQPVGEEAPLVLAGADAPVPIPQSALASQGAQPLAS
jgi:hypothetical protein